jgi:CBS domain-containing protein
MYIVGFDAKGTMHRAVTLAPDQTLADAKNAMIRYNISRIVIERKGKPLGIVTEKDIARFLYEQAQSRNMDEIRLDEVMSSNLISVGPDSRLGSCAKLMIDNKISSLIVVDAKGRLQGILTKNDLTEAYVEYYSLRHRVREFMTQKVFSVAPDEPVHAAIMLLTANQIGRVVVSKKDKPVGIVTSKDLLPLGAYFYSGDDLRHRRNARPYIPSGIVNRVQVSDVMTPDPVVVEQNSDLADAAYIMVRRRISGLPVTGARGVLAGIVTKTDVVKALAHSAA